MSAVGVAFVVIAFVALCVEVLRAALVYRGKRGERARLRRALAAAAEPDPRYFEGYGPDAAGVREPRSPIPSAGSTAAAAEPPVEG